MEGIYNKRVAVMALATALVLAGCAANQGDDKSLAQGAGGFQHVPFTLDGRLPTAEASVDGKRLPLILDLGGFASISLTTGALASVPVKFDGRSLRWRDAAGDDFMARLFQVDELTMGNLTAKAISGAEFSFPTGDQSHPQSGYVGFGLLGRYLLVFDYQKDELRAYPSGDMAAMQAECGKQSFPIDIVNSVVESRIKTEHGELIFQWDTGSAQDVVRPSAVGLDPKAIQKAQSYPFSTFEIGGVNFGRIRLPLREFAAPDVDGVLGTDFFESKVICIDPQQHVAALRDLLPAGYGSR